MSHTPIGGPVTPVPGLEGCAEGHSPFAGSVRVPHTIIFSSGGAPARETQHQYRRGWQRWATTARDGEASRSAGEN